MKITLADENTKLARIVAGDGSGLPARMTYGEGERDGVHKQKVRLSTRATIGKDWDGKADNDNIAWPLATALVREGNTELLKTAMAYRRIHDQAKSEAVLGGNGVSMGDGFSLDRFVNMHANGTASYNRPRQKKGADVDNSGKRYVTPPRAENLDMYSNDPSSADKTAPVKNWTNVPKPWNGDMPVNDMIDAQGKLASLHKRLGPLVEPLEMAAIDGATYREVGNAAGIANKAGAEGAGRALTHTALIAVRDALGGIRRADLAA